MFIHIINIYIYTYTQYTPTNEIIQLKFIHISKAQGFDITILCISVVICVII